MADVFLSYKREDRARATEVARALGAEGFSVFFDPEILVGDTWDSTIERELDASLAVVVLWSKQSRTSDWVRNEAREGKRRNCLCPALLDDCTVPLEFNAIQAADLRDWHHSNARHSEWERLLKAVHGKVRAHRSPLSATYSGPLITHSILNERVDSAAVAGVINALGLNEREDFGDCYYLANRREGIEVEIRDEKVFSVHMFAEQADGNWQYKGKLPLGLSFDDTRADVEAKLGNPTGAGEKSGVVQFCARHDVGDHTVWITYHFISPTDMRNRIHHVTF